MLHCSLKKVKGKTWPFFGVGESRVIASFPVVFGWSREVIISQFSILLDCLFPCLLA